MARHSSTETAWRLAPSLMHRSGKPGWPRMARRAEKIWLRIARRDSGYTTVTADQALDVCLCYGWIDSLRRSDEGGYFLQRYSSPPEQSMVEDQRCQGRGFNRLVGCNRQGWPRLPPQRRPGAGQPTSADAHPGRARVVGFTSRRADRPWGQSSSFTRVLSANTGGFG